MKKYIWKIINYLFLTAMIVSLMLLLIFSLKITINNIVFFNQFVEGEIIEVENRDAISSEGPLYSEKVFTIKTKNAKYKSTAIQGNHNINLSDSIYGIRKSKNLVRILSVNNNIINNKYSLIDILSIILSLLFVGFIIFIIHKKLK